MPGSKIRIGVSTLLIGPLTLVSGIAIASQGDERGTGCGVGFGPKVVEVAPYSDKDAEASFRRHDKNNDGQLCYDDMPPPLQAEWEKWDSNHDGFIDLAEYKVWYKARQSFLRGNHK